METRRKEGAFTGALTGGGIGGKFCLLGLITGPKPARPGRPSFVLALLSWLRGINIRKKVLEKNYTSVNLVLFIFCLLKRSINKITFHTTFKKHDGGMFFIISLPLETE